MRRFKLFIDLEKEEKWLNEMARCGYQLESIFLGYKFKHAEPEITVIRIDYRTFKKREDFIDYCTLFEDSGWKHIAGCKSSGLQYFKKMSENSDDDIFSDVISKTVKYKRYSNMWLTLAMSYVPILMALISSGSIDMNVLVNPKLLYLTPGLWEMSGSEFWNHFIFETPFALLRGVLWMIIPLGVILYISFSMKAKKLYNRQII